MTKLLKNNLFKFCSFNEYSVLNLEQSQLFCNHYSAFNDPFECWCKIQSGIPDPKSERDRFHQAIRTWGFTEADENSALEYYYDYLDQFVVHEIAVDAVVDSARITCFSSEPDNLLMWAHYADGLRGFCIEFDRDILLNNVGNKDVYIIPVRYSNQPPTIETMVHSIANDQIWYNEMAIDEEISLRKHLKNHFPRMYAPTKQCSVNRKNCCLIFIQKCLQLNQKPGVMKRKRA